MLPMTWQRAEIMISSQAHRKDCPGANCFPGTRRQPEFEDGAEQKEEWVLITKVVPEKSLISPPQPEDVGDQPNGEMEGRGKEDDVRKCGGRE